MKYSINAVVCLLVLFSIGLFAQDKILGDLELKWVISGQEEPETKVVWSANSLNSTLPDSIIQIKNVKANTDLDQDGNLEIVVPVLFVEDGVTRRSVHVYEATGANDGYSEVWTYTYPGAADQFVTVDESDLDGDGNLEILAVHIPAESEGDNPSVLYVFEHTGSDNDYGTAPAVEWNLDTPGRDIVRVAKAADLDNDGKQEVVLVNFTTNPSLVVASVSDFNLPVWTKEIEDNVGTTNPDIAAISFSNMDNDDWTEVVFVEGRTDTLVVIEASAADTYAMNLVGMPDAGIATTVSVHGQDAADLNGDNRDETYIASLLGAIWVVATSGDASAITASDVHLINDDAEQWLEASLGNLGLVGTDFVVAASNASKAVSHRYVGGPGGDVTDPSNYQSVTVIDSSDVAAIVPGGIRVYGLDVGNDLDGDGDQEIIFSRGSTRGGHTAPALYIAERSITPNPANFLPDSIIQIKNVKANTDLDQDGNREVIVPVLHVVDGITRRTIQVIEVIAGLPLPIWSYTYPGAAAEFVTVDESDLDGDGSLEILAVHIPAESEGDNPSVLYVFEHTGSDNDYGTAPVVEWDLDTPGRDIVRVAKAADLDNDGKQEVVLVSFTTNPSLVVASVSDFNLPVWTKEVEDNLGTTNPDIAAISIADVDGLGDVVVLIEGRTDILWLVVPTGGADNYNLLNAAMPDAGIATTVSVHGMDAYDADGDGREEVYMASLLGAIWVLNIDDNVFGADDIHLINDDPEQWLEASVGHLGLGGTDFVVAASNASKAVSHRYTGGDVTDPSNYQSVTVIDSSDVAAIVPGGIRVYGLDIGADLDGNGVEEIIFSRGSTRGGHNAPALYFAERQLITTGIEDEGAIPQTYSLQQNFPNPFNPETSITFSLPTVTHVDLEIFNVLGQKVRTLVNGTREASVHTVVWDGKSNNGIQAPSGIYFYRLKTQEFNDTKRMLLIR
mgnify:CR=1 FL=1